MKSSPNSKDKHIDSIDWMKGLCIICITMLHIENGLLPIWANYFISIFMITGFYVTNGWIHGLKTLSKILCKWKQDSVISFFLYLDSAFKYKHKLVHNQSPV